MTADTRSIASLPQDAKKSKYIYALELGVICIYKAVQVKTSRISCVRCTWTVGNKMSSKTSDIETKFYGTIVNMIHNVYLFIFEQFNTMRVYRVYAVETQLSDLENKMLNLFSWYIRLFTIKYITRKFTTKCKSKLKCSKVIFRIILKSNER